MASEQVKKLAADILALGDYAQVADVFSLAAKMLDFERLGQDDTDFDNSVSNFRMIGLLLRRLRW